MSKDANEHIITRGAKMLFFSGDILLYHHQSHWKILFGSSQIHGRKCKFPEVLISPCKLRFHHLVTSAVSCFPGSDKLSAFVFGKVPAKQAHETHLVQPLLN